MTAIAQGNQPAIGLEDQAIKTVTDFLTSYQQGKHDMVASLLHPEVVWIQPGDNQISGVKKSREELLGMGAKMAAITGGTLRLAEIKVLTANGNSVACLVHWKATHPNGNILAIDNVDVYTVENGKIIMAKIYSKNVQEENEFWGK